MKLKQILAGLLAGCMLTTTVVPAYASDVTNLVTLETMTEDSSVVTETVLEDTVLETSETEQTSSPTAFFDFDTDTSNKAEGSTLEGTIVGSGISIEADAGVSGGALRMTKQANSHFKIGQVFNASTDDFTLSIWVKYDSDFRNDNEKISLYQQNGDGRTALYLNGDMVYGTFMTGSDVTFGEAVSPFRWHMVTMTWDASAKEMKVYVNDTLKDTATLTDSAANATTDLLIGGHKNGGEVNALKGLVDELSIYNTVLDETAVTSLYDVHREQLLTVEKNALQTTVNDAEANHEEEDYLVKSWNTYATALNAATECLADANVRSVDEVVQIHNQLTDAIANLSLKPVYTAPDNTDNLASSQAPSGTTNEQPFQSGTGGSNNFRIPSMITLGDGTVVAAADARWNHSGDACSIDIMVSRSTDNGATWNYDIPVYFNDSTNAKATYGACFIDPVMVRDGNNKIYMMVDLYPGGIAINTAPKSPETASGFVDIEGEKRLVLYTSANPDNQSDENYSYYVGEHGEDGLAPVYEVYGADSYSTTPSFYMDRKFYLYTAQKEKMYCPQIDGDNLDNGSIVQQNVFFYNSLLHVRCATYLYLITSTDKGETWSDPMLLNSQIRKEENLDKFYGVGPGAGLWIDNDTEHGMVILPAYTHSAERASFIYSTDGGTTWTRSEDATTSIQSSESFLIQLDETTVRQFFRSNNGHKLRYTDHVWNGETGKWEAQETVERTDIIRTQTNQVSGIRYSKTIDGKPVILLSTAATEGTARQNGRIYVLTVDLAAEGKPLTLVDTYDVDSSSTTDYYAYSSITELEDGSVGLLYESAGAAITYKKITREELAPNVYFDGEERVEKDSLVAFFDFDQDTSNKVEGATLAGTLEGSGVSHVTDSGMSGGALHFTKEANSYFKIDGAINASTNDFTLSSWVKYEEGYSGGVYSVCLFQQADPGKTILSLNSSNQYGTFIAATDSVCSEAVRPTRWHLVTTTWDASAKEIKVYINGELKHTGTFTTNPETATTALLVGGHKTGQQPYALKGYVDELRVYNEVLGAADIQALYDVYKDSEQLKEPELPKAKDLTVTVNTNNVVRTFSEGMFGINHRYHNNGYGTWLTEENKVADGFNEYAKEASFGSVRYPGGTVSNLFEWKRSIGPVEERKATVNGSTFFSTPGQDPVQPNFGIDEAMTWIVDELDAKPVYVYGMKGSASDAADLIEYLNAPADGNLTNPNGGIDWAEIRRQNGHTAPYNVTTFEIGNEVGQWGQTYWLDGKGSMSVQDAFISGGTMTFGTGTRTVKEEDWRDSASYSDGSANQVRYTYYTPLVEGSVSVYVGDTQYTVVDTLEGAGAANVCTVDYETGKITFGDGVNGNIPANGAQIKAGYQTPQDGFLAIYEAMKDTAQQIGIEIDVLSGIDHSLADAFINKMHSLGMDDKYDGMSIHPYSGSFGDASAEDFYERALGRTLENNLPRVQHLRDKMKEVSGEDKIVGVSEFGIYNYTAPFIKTLGHAMYIANEMIYYVDLGAEYLNKHCLVDFVSGSGSGADSLGPVGQCVIQSVPQDDGSYRYVSTPSAKMFSIFNHMSGTNRVENTVSGNGIIYTYNDTYNVPTVNFISTTDDEGNTYVIAVNNAREETELDVVVEGKNLAGKEVEVWYITADNVMAENTLENPNLVDVIKTATTGTEGGVTYTLAPTSVTGFKIAADFAYGEIEEGDKDDLNDADKLEEKIWVSGIEDLTYNGAKQTQEFRVYDGNKKLVEGTDYTVSYKNNQNVYECVGGDDKWDAYVDAAEGKETEDTKTLVAKDVNAFKSKAPQVIIKMKGVYTGTQTIYYKIKPADITDTTADGTAVMGENFVLDNLKVTAASKPQKPAVTVLWKETGKNLKLNKEYTLEVKKLNESGEPVGESLAKVGKGTYELTITGTGNFTGTVNETYVVTDAVALSKAKVKVNKVAWKNVENLSDDEFAEKVIKSIKINGDLELGTDYRVTNITNKDTVGNGYLTIEGIEDKYVGSKTIAYTITGTAMSKVKTTKFGKFAYTGEEINLLDEGVSVYYGDEEEGLLAEGVQFDVEYVKNINKGTATMILKGRPEEGYTGVKKVNYKIDAAALNWDVFDLTLAGDMSEAAYTTGGATPKVVVTSNYTGAELVEGVDYTLSYKNNKKVADINDETLKVNKYPTVTVKGKGNYKGSFGMPFSIVQKDVETEDRPVIISVKDKVYKDAANNWKQSFKVLDENGKAISKSEYTSEYRLENATESLKDVDKVKVDQGATIEITVTFNEEKGNYTGSVTGTYRLIKKEYDISKATIKIANQEYTGEAIEITSQEQFDKVTLKVDGEEKELILGTDIKVAERGYQKNINKGTAKVTFKGIGENYGGEKTVSFKIVQRSVSNNWWNDLMNTLFN